MTARQSQLTGRLRLRHLLESTEARGEEMAIDCHRFHRLAREDSAPRVVAAFNLFQTPAPLAAEIAGTLADGRRLGRVLEPSAGLGRLYRAVRDIDQASPIVLVDSSPECCRELYAATEADPAAELHQADFLTLGVGRLGRFDSILMNPPFKMGTDCRHIIHAAELLAPGGRLVAICANGPRQRERLQPLATTWRELPANSFRSEGTSVAAAVLTIER